MPSKAAYHLGAWLVEPALLRISKGDQTKRVEPQLMDVLQLLVSQRGQVVSKEDLMQTVWSDVVITENVITRAISSLRKLLEDEPTNPQYIETISKTGYRLIATISAEVLHNNEQKFTIRLAKKPVILIGGIVVVVLLGAFAIRQALFTTALKNEFHPQAISNYANTEYWPAISPDGRFVAYAWKGTSDRNWDVYAKLIGTETLVRVTDDKATDLRPRWSSDGNYLYYIRYEKGGATIFKKPITGGQEIRVMEAPEYSFGDFDVSPDEGWIAFNSRERADTPLQIQLISLENGKVKTLTGPEPGFNGDIHPRFSPDGSQLAFIREKRSTSMFLYTIDLEDLQVRQVSFSPISINGFDWTTDNRSLIYSADLTGLYKLWELNIETGTSTVIKAGDHQMVMPRVAETGRVVYAKMRDNVNIYSYNLATKTVESVYATNELNLNPSYRPDMQKMCFTKPKNGKFEIWTANADGTSGIPITQFLGQYLTAPRWTANGEYIYFQGILDGQSDLFRVNALGGIPENLTSTPYDENTPHVNNDLQVYYNVLKDGRWSIWRMNETGNNSERLLQDSYVVGVDATDPFIYFCKRQEAGIWKLHLESQEETVLVSDFQPMYTGSVAVADQALYYFHEGRKQFEKFDLLTSQTKVVFKPRKRIPRMGISLSLAPDESQLLFTQIDHHDADIMLLEEQPTQ